MAAETAHTEPRTAGEYALAYVRRGWAVVPLHWIKADGGCSCGDPHDGTGKLPPNGKGKHPHTMFAPNGSLSATKSEDVVASWWAAAPSMNVGIATGAASGFDAVDIDPRDGGDETWDSFVAKNRATVPETVVQITGGGGSHILFEHDANVNVKSPGKGVQIKSTGGYIVAEPSRHHSGKLYAWDSECDPLQGAKPAPIPAWLASPRNVQPVGIKTGRAIGYLSPDRISELRSALRAIDADDYPSWIHVGMALHSTDAPEAFELWDEFSQQSAKYKSAVQVQKWASFGDHANALHVESIYLWARDRGWNGEYERVGVPMDQVTLATPAKAPEAPTGLLELPGALGHFVRYVNATAPRAQPAFAVGAALALGAAVCGRRYRTTRNNFSSLYLVHVGKSGSGKEHARTAIYSALTAADWPELIGGNGFSSDSAVISSLLLQPSHITVIDEIGALLGNIQAEGAYMARSAVTSLVEAWGNLHGSMRPKSLSMLSATRDQIDAALKRVVHNPALTLLGMTTPRTFYGALTESSIEGGFLSRLLIIETDIGRQMPGVPSNEPVPAVVVDWIKAVRTHQAQRGNLAAVDAGPDALPVLTEVPIDRAAQAVFDDYMRETITSADDLEQEGMAELEVRSVEKAMRIALSLAVSSDPFAPTITRMEAEWAVAYVKHWTARTVLSVREHMHGGKFAQWQADARKFIAKGGQKGRTEAELPRYSRTFDNLEPRQRRMVLDALASRGSIALVEIKSPAGRKRVAWVATDESVDNS